MDAAGTVLWSADRFATDYGQRTATQPAGIQMVGHLMATIPSPERSLGHVLEAGKDPYLETRDGPQVLGDWRSRYVVPISWD